MLKIQFNDNRQAPLWLVNQCFTIGRDSRNDLVLEDDGVDDFHAEIRNEQGIYYLSDTDSEGGVLVNGALIEERYALQAGDQVRIGTADLQLLDPTRAHSASGGGRWYLQVLSGEQEGKKFHINGSMTFGRSIKCELSFSDMALSRRHCEFFLRDDILELKDLASINGVTVNQQRVTTAQLKPGDEIQMGSVTMLVIGPKPAQQDVIDEDATVFMRAADLPPPTPRSDTPPANRRSYRRRQPEPVGNIVPDAPTTGTGKIVLIGLSATAVVAVVGTLLIWFT
ncbi:FHA domain-containing protein [Pseudomonas matsuisoli]|nr:FHA domain-containing protein [Pseudomonas matsuisoli]